MIYIDTNIILRLILNDSPKQTKKVIAFLKKTTEELHISSCVVMEIFQVLTASRLNFSHSQASKIITQILFDTEKLTVEHPKTHALALKTLGKRKLDYVDAFLSAQAKLNQKKVLSFDKDIDKIDRNLRIKLQ